MADEEKELEAGKEAGAELEVTRREFMRRAGIVSGLTAFGVLGVDALLDAVLGRMKAIRATQGIAGFVAREARAVGMPASAEASQYGCSVYSLYCNLASTHACSDYDFDCGPQDNLPNGFWCQDGFAPNIKPCMTPMGHACSSNPQVYPADFTCHVRFTCGGSVYRCGNYYASPADTNEFACDPSAGSRFNCSSAESGFTCLCRFWCADESNVGCSDSEFHCTSIYGGCNISYNCSPASSFDGVC